MIGTLLGHYRILEEIGAAKPASSDLIAFLADETKLADVVERLVFFSPTGGSPTT